MRTATAFTTPAAPLAPRPYLTLVSTPGAPRVASRHERLAALLAGLTSGFVLAALGATIGGGSGRTSLAVAGLCAIGLVAVLVSARATTVQARRRLAGPRISARRSDERRDVRRAA